MNSRVFTNTLSQIANRSLVILVSLLTTAVLTRTLGTSDFGDYVFLTSFVLLFVGLSDLGTTTIGIREASANPKSEGEIFGGILTLRLLFSLFLFLVFNLLVQILPQFADLKQAGFIASFVFPLMILRTTNQAVLQTNLRLDIASFLEVFASISFIVPVAVFLFLRKTLTISWLMVFWSFSVLASSVWSLICTNRYLQLKLSFDAKLIKKIFQESAPLGIYLLVYAIYDRGIDSFFLKTFSGSVAVGLYGLAYKVHGNLIFGAAFLMNSLFPILSSLKNDKEKLKRLFEKAFTVLLTVGFLILFFGYFLSPFVIKFIAGEKYIASETILRILLFATFFSFLNHLTGYLMISLNEQKKLLKFSLMALLANLFLNLIFIPKFSYLAAAIITVITEATMFFATNNFLKNKYKLNYNLTKFKENIIFVFKNRKNICKY